MTLVEDPREASTFPTVTKAVSAAKRLFPKCDVSAPPAMGGGYQSRVSYDGKVLGYLGDWRPE